MTESKHKKCSCELCLLIDRMMDHVLPKLDEKGKAVVEEIFSRMETAEMDIQWNGAKAKDGEPLNIGGRWYIPSPGNKRPNDEDNVEEWIGQA